MTATENEIKQGTSPEVLQHYLTARIDIQTPRGIATLEGIDLQADEPITVGKDGGFCGYWAFDVCLPVLRPFSALCTPLDDGTVPAVEVAKLASGWRESMGCPEPKVMFSTFGNPVFVQVDSEHVRIYESGHVEYRDSDKHYPVYNQAAIVDYFRSKHFALPVNGRTLFEGADYIAKQPAKSSPVASPTV